MSDYVLRGTKNLVSYMRTLGVDTHTGRIKVASTLRMPVIYLTGPGRDGSSFMSRRYTEAEAQSLAAILGVSVANVTTNGGQEVVG